MFTPEIIQRNLSPLHKKVLREYSFSTEKKSAQCGDKIELFIKVENGLIVDAGYTGEGCAISQASTDLMIDQIIGSTILDVSKMIEKAQEKYRYEKRSSCYLLGWEALKKII